MLFFDKKRLTKIDEETLIKLAQNDNFPALEELIKRNQNEVYATLYYLNGNCEDILDLTQESLFKMAKNIKRLNDKKKFKAWLNQIVTRVFYDYLRKKQKKPNTIPIDKKETNKDDFCISEIPCKKTKTPEETSINLELNCLIEQSIQKLPNAFKLALILREFQGLSYEEIAKITKTNIGTVKSRIARARTKLQTELKKYIA